MIPLVCMYICYVQIRFDCDRCTVLTAKMLVYLHNWQKLHEPIKMVQPPSEESCPKISPFTKVIQFPKVCFLNLRDDAIVCLHDYTLALRAL
jgi:hypothetical protein